MQPKTSYSSFTARMKMDEYSSNAIRKERKKMYFWSEIKYALVLYKIVNKVKTKHGEKSARWIMLE